MSDMELCDCRSDTDPDSNIRASLEMQREKEERARELYALCHLGYVLEDMIRVVSLIGEGQPVPESANQDECFKLTFKNCLINVPVKVSAEISCVGPVAELFAPTEPIRQMIGSAVDEVMMEEENITDCVMENVTDPNSHDDEEGNLDTPMIEFFSEHIDEEKLAHGAPRESSEEIMQEEKPTKKRRRRRKKSTSYKKKRLEEKGKRMWKKKEEKKIRFKCRECGRFLASKSSLRRHILTQHQPEEIGKPFACIFCPKRFATKPLLKYHTDGHTGYREFECNVCKKQFRWKGALTKHLRIHSKERPYKCLMCKNVSFSQRPQLNRHALMDHDFKLPRYVSYAALRGC